MKNKILQKFEKNTKIKSQQKLEQYIDYCIKNNQRKRIKGKTSHHHILPQAESCFPEYSNLKENPWNGTHLLYSDHYYAHWLLTEAIDDYGQLFAFCSMHNKDMKLGRIEEKDLMSPEEFQKKMEERSESHRQWVKDNPLKAIQASTKMVKTRLENGSYVSMGLYLSKLKKSDKWKEHDEPLRLIKFKETMSKKDENGLSKQELLTQKMLMTRKENNSYKTGATKGVNTKKNEISENGLTILENSIIKYKKTMSKKDENGLTIYDKNGKKSSLTKNKVQENGLTNAQNAGIKLSETLRRKAQKYNVINIDGNIIMKEVIMSDIPTQGLKNKTKEKYFGKTEISKKRAVKYGVEHLIGCYLEKIN